MRKLRDVCWRRGVGVQLDAGVKKLYAANVGDSGFLIIRDGELAIQSPSMQHYFDCPFQLCNQDTAPSDTAEDAMLFELDVQVGAHVNVMRM